MWLYNHVIISIYYSVTSRAVCGNVIPTVLVTYYFMLFIWRHLEHVFYNDESLWFWALTRANVTYSTFMYDTRKCVKRAVDQRFFSFHRKTRLTIIFDSSVFRDAPSLRIFDLLKVFHVTEHRVGLLCRLFDPPSLRRAALRGEQKQEHLYLRRDASSQNIQRWPWFCVSLRMCTGPAFRWRQYILPLC